MRSLLTLRKYFVRYRWRLLAGALFILGSNACAVVVPMVMKDAVDTLTGDHPGGRPLGHAALLIVGLAVASGVCRFHIRQTLVVLSRLIEYDLRQDLWQHVLRLPLAFFRRQSTGDVMAKLTNDVNAVRSFLGPVVMYALDSSVIAVFVLSVMCHFSPLLALCCLLPMPLLSLVVYLLSARVHTQFTTIQESFSALTTRVQQNFAGIRVVKAYGREGGEGTALARASGEYRDLQLGLARLQAWYRPVFTMVYGLSVTMVLGVGGWMVIHDRLSMGALVAFLVYVEQLTWPTIAFGWIVNMAQQGAASMKRLNALFAETPEPAAGSPARAGVTRLTGALEFRDVGLRYASDRPWVLRHINLTIPAGQTWAIVGRTGAGKTTLVSLIPRLYDCSEGAVLVDGMDVRELPLPLLRRHIGMTPQLAFLFSDTIATNLAFGLTAADAGAIAAAAETSRLANDRASFPDGYDTLLGERGLTLSGGQKQRACLARALLIDPVILILDDAFSAVDTQTEEQVLRGLREARRGRTTLLISHRISTVQDADGIVVLDDGGVAEQGTHAALVARGGRYAAMHHQQQLERELETLS